MLTVTSLPIERTERAKFEFRTFNPHPIEGLVPAPRGIFHHLVYVRPRQCPTPSRTTQLFHDASEIAAVKQY